MKDELEFNKVMLLLFRECLILFEVDIRHSNLNLLMAIIPAGIVWVTSEIPAQNCSNQSERKNDEDADAGHSHHGAEWNGSGCVVVDSDEVDEESSATDNSRQ